MEFVSHHDICMQEIVQIKWTSGVFMQFVPNLREVHAWLTRDESFLATSDDGAFLKHQTAPKFESLYRSSALPVHAWAVDGTGRYDFQPLGQAVLQLRWSPSSGIVSFACTKYYWFVNDIVGLYTL